MSRTQGNPMADENNDDGTNDNDDAGNAPPPPPPSNSSQDVEKLVENRVAESLKEIKAKLDKAYGARDEALRKAAELEQEKKQAEIARLKEEGKHKEASEIQIAELKAQNEALKGTNIKLTRDLDVRNHLSSLTFRSDKASEMAFKEITADLVQDEDGTWKHKSGVGVVDYIKAYAEDEANSFLFKQKQSSGSGSGGVKTSASSENKSSLFELSQDEVLKLAAEGKLPGRR
jgi:hypothetical protein